MIALHIVHSLLMSAESGYEDANHRMNKEDFRLKSWRVSLWWRKKVVEQGQTKRRNKHVSEPVDLLRHMRKTILTWIIII